MCIRDRPMDMLDFLGLFIIWGAMSVFILVYAHLPRNMCKKMMMGTQIKPRGGSATADVEEEETTIAVDNEAAMLRALIKEMRVVKEGIKSLGAKMPAGPVGIDTDGDGIIDSLAMDTNGDGVADFVIKKMDQDTVVESIEDTPR